MNPAENAPLKLEEPSTTYGTHLFLVPVLVVMEKPMTHEAFHRAYERLTMPNPLYNVVGYAVKREFGAAAGAVRVLTGFVTQPEHVPQVAANLGVSYANLNKPLGLETDGGEAAAIALAQLAARHFDVPAVREFLKEHEHKQAGERR